MTMSQMSETQKEIQELLKYDYWKMKLSKTSNEVNGLNAKFEKDWPKMANIA